MPEDHSRAAAHGYHGGHPDLHRQVQVGIRPVIPTPFERLPGLDRGQVILTHAQEWAARMDTLWAAIWEIKWTFTSSPPAPGLSVGKLRGQVFRGQA